MNAVEFNSVSAGYRGNPVVEGIEFAVPEGEMVGLLGPNGAGKTTLLRSVVGLCPPLRGSVRLFGDDVGALGSRERAKRVAVVPQQLETPMPFTVQEIVMIGRTASLNRWSRPADSDHAVVERAMVYADVAEMRLRPFTELSGGERQRVVIAMALAQQPRVILMDEATSQLDINHRLEIMQIVERLNREQAVTVIMASHDLNLAADFCGRLILLDRGRLVSDGAPADVLTEETLRRVYNCNVRIQHDPADGSVVVLPPPRADRK